MIPRPASRASTVRLSRPCKPQLQKRLIPRVSKPSFWKTTRVEGLLSEEIREQLRSKARQNLTYRHDTDVFVKVKLPINSK